MAFAILTGLSGLIAFLTLLPLWRYEAWWVRGLDFPRLELATAALALLLVQAAMLDWSWPGAWLLMTVTLASLAYQCWWIVPFTPLFPKEVAQAPREDNEDLNDNENALTILAVNVLTPNRNAEGFGSDHFPILISLLLTADDKANGAGIEADAGDEAWAREKVRSEGVDKDDVPTSGE